MRKLLTAPIFADPEQTESARLIYLILWTLGLAITLILPLGILAAPANTARWLFTIAAVDGTCLVAFAVAGRGLIRLAGYLLVALLWALVTGMAITGGGIRSAAVPAYLIIILIAGLVLGERAGMIAGIVCSVTALGLIFAEVAGVLPTSAVHHTSMTLWLTGILYAGCMMSLQYLASRSVKTALQRARQHQAERERASRALQESQEQLERAQHMAHFGSWEWDLDTNRMHWSDETFRILGAIPGSTVPERSAFEERVHPDDRVRVAKNVLRSLADQEPYTVEYRMVRPDGNERIVLEQGMPQREAGDRPMRMVGTILDITGQRRAEADPAEEDRDQRYKAPRGYHWLDADGTFIRVNETELSALGYSQEELIGKKRFDQLLTAEGAEIYRASQAGLKERGWVRDLEFNIVRKDGSIMPVLLNATAIKDESGNLMLSRITMFEIMQHHGTWAREAPRSILIVDDQAAVRSFAREALEPAGYQIVEAANGVEALARLAEATYDLLISDLYLPGEGGGDLVKAAKAQYPGLKVIVMSGAFEHVKVEPANALGANALLPKPITPENLVETVRRVLAATGTKKNLASAPAAHYLASQPPSTTRIEPLT